MSSKIITVEDKAEKFGINNQNNLKNSPFSNAVYKEISRINGQINQMSKATLIEKLNKLNLSSEGSSEILKRRLKNCYKKQKLTSANLLTVSKLFPFYVIVDFEATCEEVNPSNYPHEIIEFPAILVDTEKQKVVDSFQAYCRPVINPTLSPFCIELTGITQEQVDAAKTFPDVLQDFEKWLSKHKLGSKHKYAVVTDGPWDMGRFMYGQCKISDIVYPMFAKKWINIRKVFSNFYRSKRFSLKLMLEHLEMGFEGRQHCGLDDSRNIARVLLRMVVDGASIQCNEQIQLIPRHDPSTGEQKQRTVKSINGDISQNYSQVRRERNKWMSRAPRLSDEDTSEEFPSLV